MENKKDIIYLKGKESAFVSIMFLIAIVVFIVPIVAVFTLRFLYKLVLQVKESASVSTQVETNLNKVY